MSQSLSRESVDSRGRSVRGIKKKGKGKVDDGIGEERGEK
jgi:hypothetical protein